MSTSGAGAVVGLACGVGVLLVASWVVARRPAPIGRRIAPFVPGPHGHVTDVGAPWAGVGAWAALLAIALPRRSTSRPRSVRRLGDGAVAGAIGGVIGAGLAIVLQHGEPTIAGILLIAGFGVLVGALLASSARARQVRARRQRIDEQLPTVAELLAFAVAAGQTPLAALERVTATVSCELADEVGIVVADTRAGESLDRALRGMADRIGSPSVARFVDGLLVAIEHGTPLAELLRAQAADCRADDRRRLLELAGRKDVAMLVPVVFLILPTVVLVALFPGIASLRILVS